MGLLTSPTSLTEAQDVKRMGRRRLPQRRVAIPAVPVAEQLRHGRHSRLDLE